MAPLNEDAPVQQDRFKLLSGWIKSGQGDQSILYFGNFTIMFCLNDIIGGHMKKLIVLLPLLFLLGCLPSIEELNPMTQEPPDPWSKFKAFCNSP